MAKRTEKITQAFRKNHWVKLKEGYEVYKQAVEDGLPIRVVHPSGSFKVIKNTENLPNEEGLRFKAGEVEAVA